MRKTLIQILTLANEIGNETIGKEAVLALARNYSLNLPDVNFPKRIEDIRLYTPLIPSNKITAIKELRERAMEAGLPYGLKESKEEVERRMNGW